MIQKIKNGIKNNQTIIGNVFSLGTLQIFNYLIPLITLPYVLRVLGPEKFGLVAFATALVGYFMIITNYGFNLTATKDISVHREDLKKISEIFWNVITIKSILGGLSFLIFLGIVFVSEKFSSELMVFLYAFLMVFGEILFPLWMFQGMEKMKYITVINVIVKSLFILPIFIFVESSGDYIWIPLIASLSFLTTGIIAFFMAIKVFKIQFIVPNYESLKYHLVEGWHVFISGIFISLYTVSITFILGIFTNNTVVGYYSTAEKLIRAIQSFISVVIQAIYPSISYKVSQSKENTIVFLRKILLIISVFTGAISLILFFFASTIILLLFGSQYQETIIVFKVLSFLPFIAGFGYVTANLIMLNFGFKKELSKMYFGVSSVSIMFSILMVMKFQLLGITLSVVLTEIAINAWILLFLYRKKVNLFFNQ